MSNIRDSIDIINNMLVQHSSLDFGEKDYTDILNEEERLALQNLISSYEKENKDNNDLRKLYRRTAEKLAENNKRELADYFLAQIDEVPTFTVDESIDYYSEYYRLLKVIRDIKAYTQWHIESITETIADYIDDDKEGNKHYIGELKEEREHWKDIIRITENKKLYMHDIIDYKGNN